MLQKECQRRNLNRFKACSQQTVYLVIANEMEESFYEFPEWDLTWKALIKKQNLT